MNKSDSIAALAAALAKAQDAQSTALFASKLGRLFSSRKPYHKNDGKTVLNRFFEKIVFSPLDCWVWSGSINRLGYGQMFALGESKAHRVSWRLHNGDIPEGMMVLHRCDVRNCVNPEHLFLGTQTDNMRDMVSKGRHKVTPQHGEQNHMSRLTADAVKWIRDKYAAGGVTQKQLAQDCGVSVMTVNRAVRGVSWKTI